MTVLVNLTLWRGATVVTLPRFELEGFLRTMQDHRVTFACLVPPIVLALAKHPAVDGFDLGALEQVISGLRPSTRRSRKQRPSGSDARSCRATV